MACLSLSLPTLAAPVHAWDQKLLHGDQCCQFIFAYECCWTTWFLNKPQLVLHFVCIWTGWDWDGVGRFECGFCLTVFVVFFLIWSKEAETCLKVFQLPIFLFDITCPSILCQPPQRKQEAFPVCFWSNQLPEPKDHGEHPFFAVKTRWYRGTNSTCFFLLLWPSKTNHTFKNSVKSGPNSSSRLLQLAWLQGDLKSLKLFVGRC